ncbi:MAG TPA: hypothetical protein VM577_13950 [Anaerovoracaceae bacterium]|nr:hypothetical protein [Anaerovoracaceae bacterium]
MVPELAAPLWNSVLKEKKVITLSFGGLLESFFSFCILEAINRTFPHLPLHWAGDSKFLPILQMQGLAKYYSKFDPAILEKFPTPVFFDKQDGAYFNCLLNYFNVKTYYGTKGYKDQRVASRQIFEKGMIPWDPEFIPKFRNNTLSTELNNWMKTSKIILNQRFVIILPDKTGYSQHNIIGLDWTPTQVKAFGEMLSQRNIAPLVFSNNPHKYYDPALHVLPVKLDFLFQLLPKAKAILSKDIDFMFVGQALSEAAIFSKPLKKAFDLNKNNKFLGKDNLIYYSKNLLPLEVFNKIMEIK